MKICSVEGCGKPHWAKGYCHSCSSGMYRAENTDRAREVWRDYYYRNREALLERQRERQRARSAERQTANPRPARIPRKVGRQIRRGRVGVSREDVRREMEQHVSQAEQIQRLRRKYWDLDTGLKRETPLTDEQAAG